MAGIISPEVLKQAFRIQIKRQMINCIFFLLSGDGGGAGGDGDPIVGSTNSEKKSGYETNLYLYSVSTRKV